MLIETKPSDKKRDANLTRYSILEVSILFQTQDVKTLSLVDKSTSKA